MHRSMRINLALAAVLVLLMLGVGALRGGSTDEAARGSALLLAVGSDARDAGGFKLCWPFRLGGGK